MDIDPIKQFSIEILFPLQLIGFDISITNISLFMIISSFFLSLLFWSVPFSSIIPDRRCAIFELLYNFILSLNRDNLDKLNRSYVPLILTSFLFILTFNFLGVIPIFPSVTSQIVIPFTLALTIMAVTVIRGLWKHSFKFFAIFTPPGIPKMLYLVVTPIEIVSFLSRPVSMGMRLWISILAGHILLKLFAYFVSFFVSEGSVLMVIPLIIVFCLVLLEILISFIQAYVFSLLSCIYLKDSIKLH